MSLGESHYMRHSGYCERLEPFIHHNETQNHEENNLERRVHKKELQENSTRQTGLSHPGSSLDL